MNGQETVSKYLRISVHINLLPKIARGRLSEPKVSESALYPCAALTLWRCKWPGGSSVCETTLGTNWIRIWVQRLSNFYKYENYIFFSK